MTTTQRASKSHKPSPKPEIDDEDTESDAEPQESVFKQMYGSAKKEIWKIIRPFFEIKLK